MLEASPNHFRRIAEIAERVVALNRANSSREDLRAAAPNSAAPAELEKLYAELFPLLEAPNAVDYDLRRDAHENYLAESLVLLQRARGLARCLLAESESMAAAGRSDAAAEYALANVRLGTTLKRGGLLIHLLVGIAIESIGYNQLV